MAVKNEVSGVGERREDGAWSSRPSGHGAEGRFAVSEPAGGLPGAQPRGGGGEGAIRSAQCTLSVSLEAGRFKGEERLGRFP